MPTETGAGRARFAPGVVLTKEEVFRACQALADAGSALVRSGAPERADELGDLFALLEDRLSGRSPGRGRPAGREGVAV